MNMRYAYTRRATESHSMKKLTHDRRLGSTTRKSSPSIPQGKSVEAMVEEPCRLSSPPVRPTRSTHRAIDPTITNSWPPGDYKMAATSQVLCRRAVHPRLKIFMSRSSCTDVRSFTSSSDVRSQSATCSLPLPYRGLSSCKRCNRLP